MGRRVIQWSRKGRRAEVGPAQDLGWPALPSVFFFLLIRFSAYGALLNATFSKVATQIVSAAEFTFHNSRIRVL